MIGFRVVNLVPPEAPDSFMLQTPVGTWEFAKEVEFDRFSAQVAQGACAELYSMVYALPQDNTSTYTVDATFEEALHICLGATFATGAAVTIRRSLPGSEISPIQTGARFPRERGIPSPAACVSTFEEFVQLVEQFVRLFASLNISEKFLLLTHHFIDAMSCWSLENLYLSGSTLLQIIADTEKTLNRPFAAQHAQQRSSRVGFMDYLAGAANRVGIPALSYDVVSVRNSLIHNGTLQNAQFSTQQDAAEPIAAALSWFDKYMYAVLGLGTVPLDRHKAHDYAYGLNSFSF